MVNAVQGDNLCYDEKHVGTASFECFGQNYERYFTTMAWTSVLLTSFAIVLTLFIMLSLHVHSASILDEQYNRFSGILAASFSNDITFCYIVLLLGVIATAVASYYLAMVKVDSVILRHVVFYYSFVWIISCIAALAFYISKFKAVRRKKANMVRSYFGKAVNAVQMRRALSSPDVSSKGTEDASGEGTKVFSSSNDNSNSMSSSLIPSGIDTSYPPHAADSDGSSNANSALSRGLLPRLPATQLARTCPPCHPSP
jgi:hypothetical protein